LPFEPLSFQKILVFLLLIWESQFYLFAQLLILIMTKV